MINIDQKNFLIKLCEKYGKNSFSYEEAQNYFISNENYTKKDFNFYWNKSFNPIDQEKSYIARNGENFYMLHKALTLIPKKEKSPWTHTEIISIVSIISTSLVALTVAILGVFF